jgi:hypothetical protein
MFASRFRQEILDAFNSAIGNSDILKAGEWNGETIIFYFKDCNDWIEAGPFDGSDLLYLTLYLPLSEEEGLRQAEKSFGSFDDNENEGFGETDVTDETDEAFVMELNGERLDKLCLSLGPDNGRKHGPSYPDFFKPPIEKIDLNSDMEEFEKDDNYKKVAELLALRAAWYLTETKFNGFSLEEYLESIFIKLPKKQSFEVCYPLIEKNPSLFKSVKKELYTDKEYYDLCIAAVTRDAPNLQFIEAPSDEICFTALASWSAAGPYVPEAFWTDENSARVIQTFLGGKGDGFIIHYLPQKHITEELCLAAVKQDGCSLDFVPEKFRTEKVCLEAVKTYGEPLKYVPEKMRTLEICETAIRAYPYALQYVPEALKEKLGNRGKS